MWLGSQGIPECCQDVNYDETNLTVRMMFEVQECLMFSDQVQLYMKTNVKYCYKRFYLERRTVEKPN